MELDLGPPPALCSVCAVRENPLGCCCSVVQTELCRVQSQGVKHKQDSEYFLIKEGGITLLWLHTGWNSDNILI